MKGAQGLFLDIFVKSSFGRSNYDRRPQAHELILTSVKVQAYNVAFFSYEYKFTIILYYIRLYIIRLYCSITI